MKYFLPLEHKFLNTKFIYKQEVLVGTNMLIYENKCVPTLNCTAKRWVMARKEASTLQTVRYLRRHVKKGLRTLRDNRQVNCREK